jgi:hypothetical protein
MVTNYIAIQVINKPEEWNNISILLFFILYKYYHLFEVNTYIYYFIHKNNKPRKGTILRFVCILQINIVMLNWNKSPNVDLFHGNASLRYAFPKSIK